MSGLEPVIFGLTLTQLLPLIVALATIGTVITGVFKFLMGHVTKEAKAVRKEMTDKLSMHEKSLNETSSRIVDRMKEIRDNIGMLNDRINEIKEDVNESVKEVKREIVTIDQVVNKRLDFKRVEIQRLEKEIDILRHELKDLELEHAKQEAKHVERMERQDVRLDKQQTGTTQHRYDTGHSKVSEELHGEGTSRDATTRRDSEKDRSNSSLSDEEGTQE